MITVRQLLDGLHLWLHREGGDRELAHACERFDWAAPQLQLTTAERRALVTLEIWHRGIGVDLIGDAEDFHEAMSDADCTAMDEMVVRLDGRVSFGNAEFYVRDNVIPLRRRS